MKVSILCATETKERKGRVALLRSVRNSMHILCLCAAEISSARHAKWAETLVRLCNNAFIVTLV